MDEVKGLEGIAEKIKQCTRCKLHETRTNPVPGAGSLNSRVVFIGEAPGYWEDQKGEPFVGAAGRILDELLGSIGLNRGDVFITNVVKCRPPGNRDPLPEEIKACKPFLEKQIEAIKPRVIVTLGRFAMEYIFKKYGLPEAKISQVHGKDFKIQTLNGEIKILALYHPAFATHNPNYKEVLLEDFKKLGELIR
ncbi:MAG: uracil-DNA glycosylase [Candidatus Diapherotrites archaeon]|nr:uracil-DNA glycosylase [Candidatus Diapherotrites archaeon]